MKYTATLDWKEVELNFNPKYNPLDFLRNNDVFEADDEELNMEKIIKLMKI